MILYGVPLSPFVRKVMMMLHESDLDFEQKPIVPGAEDAEFRAISPLGRIPAFADGDFEAPDSSVICHYLERRNGCGLMATRDAATFARMVGFDKFADDDLGPALFPVLVERVVKPIRLGAEPDEAVVEQAVTEKMPPVFDTLDAQLDGRPWFVGETFTYADIALGAHMTNLRLSRIDLDAARWPALAGWFDRLCERPAVVTVLDAAARFRLVRANN